MCVCVFFSNPSIVTKYKNVYHFGLTSHFQVFLPNCGLKSKSVWNLAKGYRAKIHTNWKKMNSFIKFLVGGKEKILEDLVDRRTVSEWRWVEANTPVSQMFLYAHSISLEDLVCFNFLVFPAFFHLLRLIIYVKSSFHREI